MLPKADESSFQNIPKRRLISSIANASLIKYSEDIFVGGGGWGGGQNFLDLSDFCRLVPPTPTLSSPRPRFFHPPVTSDSRFLNIYDLQILDQFSLLGYSVLGRVLFWKFSFKIKKSITVGRKKIVVSISDLIREKKLRVGFHVIIR